MQKNTWRQMVGKWEVEIDILKIYTLLTGIWAVLWLLLTIVWPCGMKSSTGHLGSSAGFTGLG